MTGTERAPAGTNPSLAISNLTVRLLSQYTGRGPTKARTYLNDDLVTIVLQDSLTHAERTLVEKGKAELVLATRRTFQDVMGRDLIDGVQEILGREVVALCSANHVDPDIAVETLILAPVSDPTT
jgi:uncharacterized protein YbcI